MQYLGSVQINTNHYTPHPKTLSSSSLLSRPPRPARHHSPLAHRREAARRPHLCCRPETMAPLPCSPSLLQLAHHRRRRHNTLAIALQPRRGHRPTTRAHTPATEPLGTVAGEAAMEKKLAWTCEEASTQYINI